MLTMKKLLNLLSVLTITGTAMPNIIAANSYERHKRQTPPSLQELLTIVNIGEIEINDQEHIIVRLREINHPILSRPDFLENMVVENITRTSAIIHARENIQSNKYPIPRNIIFTLNFTAQRPRLSTIITNTNLGNIINNCFFNIFNALIRLNPQIIDLLDPSIGLVIFDITTNSAIIRNEDTLETVTVNFNTNNYSLDSLLTVTDLGEIPDNLPSTILDEILRLNPNIDISYIRSFFNITNNSVIIEGNLPNSNYNDDTDDGYYNIWHDTVNVSFSLKQENIYATLKPIENHSTTPENIYATLKPIENHSTTPENIYATLKPIENHSTTPENIYATLKPIENHSTTPENKPTKETLLTNQKIFDKFNNLSKEQKQQKLNEINQHYQNLSKNDKKIFKNKLEVLGTSLIGGGISAIGTKIIVSSGGANSAISVEGTELTPLLSATTTENLAVAETVTAVETAAVEGTVIGAEATTSLALAPETLGLSLVIGGLIIAGTSIWWINSNSTNITTKHESNNQYNEIEKYYKFLKHDQLKLGLDNSKWNKIKEIYKENSNNYQEFLNKVKLIISNFHKEDHSGWGGSISDDDINTLINILYNHFQEINNHFLSNSNHGWKIITNTVGSYFIIEQE